MATPIASNMLFSLDGKDMMESFGKLESAMNFYGSGARTMAQWSDTAGGGRFTLKVSQYFIHQIKEWITGTGSTNLALPEFSYHSRYEKFKQKLGVSTRPWLLFGNVYKNLDVIWRGKHGRTVGIKRSVKVPRIGVDGKQYGSISVARYAAINEFGGKFHKPRPLFSIAMLKFVSQHFPPMVKVVKRSIIDAVNKEGKFMTAAVSSEGMGSASNVLSQKSLEGAMAVARANVDSIFRFQANEMYDKGAEKKSHIARKLGTYDFRQGGAGATDKAMARSMKDVDSWLKKEGLDMDDLKKGDF